MRTSLTSTLLRLVRERAHGTSLRTLRREGVEKVTVLDAGRLQEIVEQAVQQTLLRRGIELGGGEREAFLAEAAERVRDLMRERDDYRARSKALSEEKSALSRQLTEVEQRFGQEKEKLETRIRSSHESLVREREMSEEKLLEQQEQHETRMREISSQLERERLRLASQIDVLKRDLDITRSELQNVRAAETSSVVRERELRAEVDQARQDAGLGADSSRVPTGAEELTAEEAVYLADPAAGLPDRIRTAVEELLKQRELRRGGRPLDPAEEAAALREGIVHLSIGILNDLRRHALVQARQAQKERIENLERRLRKLKGNLATAEELLATAQSARDEDSGVASLSGDAQGLDPGDTRYQNKKKLLEEIFNQNLHLRGLIQEGGVSDA
jgi:myosin heavy subunit